MKTGTNISIMHSIATRLLLVSLTLYLIVVTCANIGHLWMNYRYERIKILSDMTDIKKAFNNGLAISLWDLDQKALKASVQGMLQTPTIVGIKIWDTNGVLITIGGIVATQDGERGETGLHINLLGCTEQDNIVHKNEHHDYELFEHQFPIKYSFENETVGKATIYSSSSLIYQQIKIQMVIMIIKSLLTLIAFSIALLWAFNKYLRKPLNILTDGTADISIDTIESFSLDLETTGRNEIKVLAETITGMVKKLHNFIKKEVEIQKVIKVQNEDLKKEQWFKTGEAGLTKKMSGEKNLQVLTKNIIAYLSQYLNAQIGTFYIKKETDYFLEGSFAVNEEKLIQKKIQPGQGLVGEAALQKKYILTRKIPENYIKIESSVGATEVNDLLVFPILLDENIKGVIELATLENFEDHHIDFVSRVSENIALTVNSAQSQFKTKKLLQQTQQQAEELQTQQEELKNANEGLEQQTQMLRASEEELKQQSEELKVSNEELEEKQEVLEKQKSKIQSAKRDVETKANELALASKYKSEFLANMSHEFRTPLNSMLLLSKGLATNKKGNLDETDIEDIKIIHEGGKSLLSLINDIMDLSKVEAGRLSIHIEKTKLESIAHNLHRMFSPLAVEKGLYFEVDIDKNLPQIIKTDSQRLEQILKNFIANAFKFTFDGSIVLKIKRPDSNVKFKNTAMTHKNTIAFAVTDSGIGIPETKQQAIFEAFQQQDGSTSRKFGGTGLGLTISRELSTKLGGEIHLKSKENKGSTFTLFLQEEFKPDKLKTQGKQDNKIQLPQQAKINKPKIIIEHETPHHNLKLLPQFIPDDQNNIHKGDKTLLIIEDDKEMAKIFRNFGKNNNYKCLVAGDGRSGILLAKEYEPNGIILDIGLPDISGYEVLDQLKFSLKTRHIPTQIISGAVENQKDSLSRGAIGFQTKPITEKGFDSVLQDIAKIKQGEIKNILLIEDDQASRIAITKILESSGIQIKGVNTGKEGCIEILSNNYDCVILDIGLPDMSGFDVLENIDQEKSGKLPPVIIYTGKELTDRELRKLDKYSSTIVIKGASSPERLLDDVSLFMHNIESKLSNGNKETIQMLHDEDAMLKGRKILLVDDDMRNTYALSRNLINYGMDVEMAANGKEAIESLEKDENYELILMDIMMPIMDGIKATREIRKMIQYKDIPIIALTAKTMPEDREKAIEAGASEYLMKPIDFEKLLSIMRIWLFKHS